MAYLRGTYYIWRDYDDATHFCVAGKDAVLPKDVTDGFVAMRWAQMTPEEREAAVAWACEAGDGNVGADELRASRGLPTAMDKIERIIRERKPLLDRLRDR